MWRNLFDSSEMVTFNRGSLLGLFNARHIPRQFYFCAILPHLDVRWVRFASMRVFNLNKVQRVLLYPPIIAHVCKFTPGGRWVSGWQDQPAQRIHHFFPPQVARVRILHDYLLCSFSSGGDGLFVHFRHKFYCLFVQVRHLANHHLFICANCSGRWG